MKPLNAKLLKKFLNQAASHLKGEWLLVGGTLLPAVGVDTRPTVDIDLVNLKPKDGDQGLELMRLADSLGLSVESINQAASFFVQQVGYKKSDLLLLHSGKAAKIYRPSVELYWKLKLKRFSESDANDCLEYFNFCKANGDALNLQALKDLLSEKKASLKGKDETARLQKLSKLFSKSP